MKILNIGSMNTDYVYSVDHFVRPGETLAAEKYEIFPGGKGLNQSVAMAKAGLEVWHAGIAGKDGEPLLEFLAENGVHTELVKKDGRPGGHTIIQVNNEGQNSIILYGGTNFALTEDYVYGVLENFSQGDIVALQNEVNLLPYIIERAYEKRLTVALNPSPFNSAIGECGLDKVTYFFVNEIEAWMMTGEDLPERQMEAFMDKYPKGRLILTLGDKGSFYTDGSRKIFQDIFKVKAVDTTAAGDTFTGYFLSAVSRGMEASKALLIAAKASSICVSRKGAAVSVPEWNEVVSGLQEDFKE